MQHPGHTSDLKHDFDSRALPHGLEYEFGNPAEPRQQRRCSIEQRAAPEFAMGAPHNHGPGGSRHGENPDQSTPLLELPVERFGSDLVTS